MQAVSTFPLIPEGTIKSLGSFGPPYEVGQALLPLEDGDWLVEIQMVQTGERAEYRLSSIANDREAR